MHEILRLGLFASFLAILLYIATHRDEQKRRAIVVMVSYVTALVFFVAMTERDFWPFSRYVELHGLARPDAEFWEVAFMGVDADGVEWRLDERAWSPISNTTMQQWFDQGFGRLSDADRSVVLLFLLDRAERKGRGRHAYLGVAAAPSWWMWHQHPSGPGRYRALRVYRLTWTTAGRLIDPRNVKRQLVAEVRR